MELRSGSYWLAFAGEGEALERLIAELADSGLSGAEEVEEGGRRILRVWWPIVEREGARILGEAACLAAGAEVVEEGELQPEDWLSKWKEHFHPLRVGRRIWVCPPWEVREAGPGEVLIVLDPRMAFGTGHHATTRLCLEFLEERVRPGDTVLDVGSGSGILSIAAAKLGASRAWGVEEDRDIQTEIIDNLRRNGVEGVVRPWEGDFAQSCPLRATHVVSNIILEKQRPLLRSLAAAAQGGFVILSGAETEQRDEAAAAIAAAGLEVLEGRILEGWCGFLCRPGPAGRG